MTDHILARMADEHAKVDEVEGFEDLDAEDAEALREAFETGHNRDQVPLFGQAAAPAGDLLDPKNNMPLEPNQQPCPGQRRPLSTERIQSNIPKGGTDSTWLYPSPQMFFNGALFVLLSGVLTAASGGGAAAKRLLALATHHHPPPTKIHQHKPLLPSPEAQGQGQRRERGADGLGRARAQQ